MVAAAADGGLPLSRLVVVVVRRQLNLVTGAGFDGSSNHQNQQGQRQLLLLLLILVVAVAVIAVVVVGVVGVGGGVSRDRC